VWAAWPTVESERTAVKADLGRTMKERIGAIRSARKLPCAATRSRVGLPAMPASRELPRWCRTPPLSSDLPAEDSAAINGRTTAAVRSYLGGDPCMPALAQ